MRAFKKIKLNAKDLRTALKSASIKAVQLRTHKDGVLICIEDLNDQPTKFVSFCKENNLKQNPLKNEIIDMGGDKRGFQIFRVYIQV